MLKYKLIGVALFLKAFIGKVDFEAARLDVEQSKKYYNIERVGTVSLLEISGLTTFGDDIFIITDSGGEAAIYTLDQSLNIKDTFYVKNTSNIDWETVTVDKQKNFFIGDVGNNISRRQDLRIYKLNQDIGKIDTISFSYKLQPGFPPKKKQRNYDSEAMFWYMDQLHLFSKNWGRKCVKHYVLPDEGGNYELVPREELKLNAMITGAAISEDGETVVLLAYGKLYFFKMANGKIFTEPLMLIETTRFGQNEAITFLDDKTLLICNEAGKFYKVSFSLPINN
jgi:hypothetical protein